MTNNMREYMNQDKLKRLYDEALAGKRPKSKIRRLKCPRCGRDFYTLVDSKKYYLRWTCCKTFTPDRSDAVYCCKHVPITIHFRAAGIITVPDEKEIVAAMEEIRNSPSNVA